MKLIRLVLLSGFWLLCGCPNGIGADYLDQKTYALEDEASYAVLIYDIHNSFILSLLGVQSDGPTRPDRLRHSENGTNTPFLTRNSLPRWSKEA